MNQFIKSSDDLVTTQEQIRAGFLAIALEKNNIGDPYVKQALAFKAMVASTKDPDEFLNMTQIRPFMLTAAGLSEKSLQHLTYDDQTAVIKELIDKFLKPAGPNYIDEATYRFLLTKGDAVGGIMRNRIGSMGQEKLIRCILSCMNVQGINYEWIPTHSKSFVWHKKPIDESGLEKNIKALHWRNQQGERILGFNMTLAIVNKNVDICLFAADKSDYANGRIGKRIPLNAIMLGELKSGIDPAGADEHWKTGNTALERIRTSFSKQGYNIKTSFIGAAIAKAMAIEIYEQLRSNVLSNAANLTNNNQLVDYCNWLLLL